jgi:hypothetical protein
MGRRIQLNGLNTKKASIVGAYALEKHKNRDKENNKNAYVKFQKVENACLT